MATSRLKMGVNDLAHFVFLGNNNDSHIELNLYGITDNRDLFCFCIDLMCKGIVLLFGGQSSRVTISNMSEDQFDMVKKKLKNAGIKCNLEIFAVETPVEQLIDLYTQNILNVHAVRNSPENLKLEEYHFDLQTANFIYKIRFTTVRHVQDFPQNAIL